VGSISATCRLLRGSAHLELSAICNSRVHLCAFGGESGPPIVYLYQRLAKVVRRRVSLPRTTQTIRGEHLSARATGQVARPSGPAVSHALGYSVNPDYSVN